MAKSIRSKVKKRLRTVKRGVVKRELAKPESKLGSREVQKEGKIREALSGYLQPGKARKNWFRSDDPEAEVPQHNFRQGPDYRSGNVDDSGYAVVGSNRPKLGRFGGDAPTANPTPAASSEPTMEVEVSAVADPTVARLLRNTEQIVPWNSTSRAKKRLKNKIGKEDAKFRWV
jgi:hypothetical protein